MCAELQESLDQPVDTLAVTLSETMGWMYAYPTGGLIQKYVRGDIGIAVCRSKFASRDTIQDGFVLRMGMAHQPLGVVNPSDVNRRWDWFNGEQSLVLPQVIKLGDMPKHMSPPS